MAKIERRTKILMVNHCHRLYKLQTEKGQVLVLSTIILMFLVITIAAFQYYLSVQTKHTVKSVKQTSAFNIAQAGIEKAIWKLNSVFRGWELAAEGNIPSGYKGETVYTYKTKGKTKGYYRIKIATCTTKSSLTLYSIAKDKTGAELSGIKVKYVQHLVGASVKSGEGIVASGSIEVHWGSLLSINRDLEVRGAIGRKLYPRKYAGKGRRVIGNPITRDPNSAGVEPDAGTGNNYNPPYEKEYWEWHSNYDLQSDVINLDYYRTRAKNYRPPQQHLSGTADPPGSGYFPSGNLEFRNKFRDYCSTATYFVENGNIIFRTNVFIGPANGTIENNEVTVICARGNVDFSGTSAQANYTISVPENAWKEYQAIDTSAIGQYPGDLGYRKSGGNYVVPDEVGFNGFLYVGNALRTTGNVVLVGVILVNGNTNVSGTVLIYYNPKVDKNIKTQTATWAKVYGSWAEFNPESFDNPIWR